MTTQLKNSFSLLVEKLSGWVDTLILHLPNFLVALIVVIVMFFAAKYVKKGVRRLVSKVVEKDGVVKLISNLVGGILVFLSLLLVLSILELQETVTSLLAGAGIIGLVAGLAFKDILSNTFAGVILTVKDLYSIGDHIEVGDVEGLIEKIGFRFTTVKTFHGQLVIVPNSTLVNNPVINYTVTGKRMVALECSVSYDDDLEKAERIARQALPKSDDFDPETETEFFYTGFGDSSISFQLRFWLPGENEQKGFLQARSEAIKKLKAAFDEEGITIPFPIRTLDLKGKQENFLFAKSVSLATQDN